jgi:hypothetical protein
VPDLYPSDLTARIRELERAIEDLRAATQTRQPLIAASAGWVMRHRASPTAPPSGDVHIYAQSGTLWSLSTLGSVPLLERQAGAVPTIVGADAAATYTVDAQTLINTLKTTVNLLMSNMRLEGLLSVS